MRLEKLNEKSNLVTLHLQLCMMAITEQNRLDLSFEERFQNTSMIENKDIHVYRCMLQNVPPSAHMIHVFGTSNIQLSLLKRVCGRMLLTQLQKHIIILLVVQQNYDHLVYHFYFIIGYHKRAAMRSNEFFAEPIRVIQLFYSIFDSYFARRFTLKVLPRLGIMSRKSIRIRSTIN